MLNKEVVNIGLTTEVGTPYAVFNPHDQPAHMLPVIYGFSNGGQRDWWTGVLLAQDGTSLGSHLCSHEGYMLNDLGILHGSRPDRHETFRKHYPDGYRMDFVPYDQVRAHPVLWPIIEAGNAKDTAEKRDRLLAQR